MGEVRTVSTVWRTASRRFACDAGWGCDHAGIREGARYVESRGFDPSRRKPERDGFGRPGGAWLTDRRCDLCVPGVDPGRVATKAA